MASPRVEELRLDGGDLALDFVNTLGGPRNARPNARDDALHGYADLVAWSRRAGLVSDREAKALRTAAAARPGDAEKAFADALSLRGLIYDVFRAIADGGAPAEELRDRLRDAEREALAAARLAPSDGHLGWTWPHTGERLEAPLWPLTHAALELLIHGPLERLKVCANCRWLFLDKSRNRSRRWCSMNDCGTAVKKERFVERRRQRRASARAAS
jgi:predicted RNA-binding Zn ribbon-like protein